MDTSHRSRRARLAGVRANAHTQGIVNGELVYVWRKVKKNRTDARTALGTHRWYSPAMVLGKEMNNVFVSHRGRVTKIAPECLGKVSVAEQMSWDMTTKEKALFESALDKENLSWEEPLLDESVEFPDAEMRDTLVGSPNLEEEIKSPVNDDGDLPVSEPPVSENEDHNEYGTQVKEPDLVTDESPEVERDQLRRRLTSKQPWSVEYGPEPSLQKEERMESRFFFKKKRHASTCLSCCTAFLVKAARSKEKRWHGLNGREKRLFLEAVSKQWNARQENAAAAVIPPAEAKVIWHTLRKQGLQDRVLQLRFVLVDKNEGKSTADNPPDTKASTRIVLLGYADPDVLDIRRDSPTACREAIMSCWLLVPARDEKMGITDS